MLKYSKGQKISLNLSLINNDGSPENNAIVNYKIYNESNTLILSGGPLIYNEQLGAYIDIINPSSDWTTQEEGLYFINWEINNVNEIFPNEATEELYIESYDEKLDKILGLVHQNILIDQPGYDRFGNLKSARVRIYKDSSSVGTNSNILATYKITSESTELGQFSYWKQVEI